MNFQRGSPHHTLHQNQLQHTAAVMILHKSQITQLRHYLNLVNDCASPLLGSVDHLNGARDMSCSCQHLPLLSSVKVAVDALHCMDINFALQSYKLNHRSQVRPRHGHDFAK